MLVQSVALRAGVFPVTGIVARPGPPEDKINNGMKLLVVRLGVSSTKGQNQHIVNMSLKTVNN